MQKALAEYGSIAWLQKLSVQWTKPPSGISESRTPQVAPRLSLGSET